MLKSLQMLAAGDIEKGLTEVLRDVFGDDDIVAIRDLTASQVEGWDSLAHVRVLLSIERYFKIRVSATEASRLKTVGDLADLIQMKAGGQQG